MVITITSAATSSACRSPPTASSSAAASASPGMDLKEEDYVEHLFVASTHDYLLFFTSVGKVYRLKVHELPLAGAHGARQAPRQPAALAAGREGARRHRHAQLRRQRGQVPHVRHAQGHRQEDALRLLQHAAQGRRHHRHQHPRGRRAHGGAPLLRRRRHPHGQPPGPGASASTRATCARWGATPPASRHAPAQGRRGDRHGHRPRRLRPARGHRERLRQAHAASTSTASRAAAAWACVTIKLTDRKGYLAGVRVVRENHEIMLQSRDGVVIRMRADEISRYGRATQGVRVMNMHEGDMVSAVARMVVSERAPPKRRSRRTRSGPAGLERPHEDDGAQRGLHRRPDRTPCAGQKQSRISRNLPPQRRPTSALLRTSAPSRITSRTRPATSAKSAGPMPKRVISATPRRRAPAAVKPSSSGAAW